jgi:hypothetical protein
MRGLLPIIAFIAAVLLGGHAQAQTFAFGGSAGAARMTLYFSDGTSEAVTAVDQGWWSPTAANFGGNHNIITGAFAGTFWNDFFVFSLDKNGRQVIAANLVLNTAFVDGAPSIRFWDVSTPLETLENLTTGPNPAVYADLGSGTLFGSARLPMGGNTTVIIPLDGAAISAINGTSDMFALGGSANTDPIPEPASVLALISGVAVLGAVRYRARQAAKRSALS